MAEFTDALALLFDDLILEFGGVAITYDALGGNTKAIGASSCVQKSLVRSADPNGGLDHHTCTFLVVGAEFATGFSGTNPVLPTAGHQVTVAGQAVWTLAPQGLEPAAKAINGGVMWVLLASRRVQKGVA